MKMRNIQARLKKLEAVSHRLHQQKERKLRKFYVLLLNLAAGYYLGNPQPNEKHLEATARGLGFEGSENLFSVLHTSPATFKEHAALAINRLLAKFGASPSHDSDTLDAFKRMADGFSEPHKEYLQRYARELGIEWPFA
jgi:hypothetical protein